MKRVAIQGISASYHDIAARAYFTNEQIEVVPCETFDDVFEMMRQDNQLLGMVAIENTIAGSLQPNYDRLKESNSMVIGEYKLRISHTLAALKGQSIEDIKEIHSHPIALMQCGDFLDKYPHIKVVERGDTASSAKAIHETQTLAVAAICSKSAAQTYSLDILADGIETNKKNFTRFLVLADSWQSDTMTNHDRINKSSILFALPHEEGSLSKVLIILSCYGINLTKIHSQPIIGRAWEYLFYIDLTFNDYYRYKQAINAILPLTKEFKLLGEYEEDHQ